MTLHKPGDFIKRLMLVLGLCVMGVGQSIGQPGRSAGDEAGVREVVRSYVAARERGDAATLATLFTEDADQLTSSGEWRRGRTALVQGTLASSKANSGARSIAIQTVRFPAADVAIADGEYTIAATGGAAERKMWTSFVIVRAGGSWRISAIRNMLPAAAAR
jgi:uncharacterized protein (TIGR02246 family)